MLVWINILISRNQLFYFLVNSLELNLARVLNDGGGTNGTLPTKVDWRYPGKGPCILIGDDDWKDSDELVHTFLRLLLLSMISSISSESLRLFWSSEDEIDEVVSQDADVVMPYEKVMVESLSGSCFFFFIVVE